MRQLHNTEVTSLAMLIVHSSTLSFLSFPRALSIQMTSEGQRNPCRDLLIYLMKLPFAPIRCGIVAAKLPYVTMFESSIMLAYYWREQTAVCRDNCLLLRISSRCATEHEDGFLCSTLWEGSDSFPPSVFLYIAPVSHFDPVNHVVSLQHHSSLSHCLRNGRKASLH